MTTKHSHKPNFGRHIGTCLRCQELAEGATPATWATSGRGDDERRAREIRDHDCRAASCSVVCTFGDW